MAWQSPYRGEQSALDRVSPRAKDWVSRGVILVIGLLLVYFAARGMIRMSEADFMPAAATQSSYRSYQRRGTASIWLWLVVIVMAFVGLTMAVAALLPVGKMQVLFERFNRPPATGDRSPETDDYYDRPWWLGGRGWWW